MFICNKCRVWLFWSGNRFQNILWRLWWWVARCLVRDIHRSKQLDSMWRLCVIQDGKTARAYWKENKIHCCRRSQNPHLVKDLLQLNTLFSCPMLDLGIKVKSCRNPPNRLICFNTVCFNTLHAVAVARSLKQLRPGSQHCGSFHFPRFTRTGSLTSERPKKQGASPSQNENTNHAFITKLEHKAY